MGSNIDILPGKRIRSLRTRLRLSRKEFWEITGFSMSTLKELEIGRCAVTPSKARLLSMIFIWRFGLLPYEADEEFILHGTSKHKCPSCPLNNSE